MVEFRATGTKGNRKPALITAGPPSTAVSAAAPPGGCRQRVNDMAAMASATARPDAITGSCTKCATVTPTSAEIELPPMIDQGCASGLDGTAKSSTADAPIGATSSATCGPPPMASPLITPVSAMPMVAPMQAMSRSRSVAPARIGTKRRKAMASPARWSNCGPRNAAEAMDLEAKPIR
jgi:hypothetical protein